MSNFRNRSSRAVKYDPTPQDEDLPRLNTRLNKTYLPYGARGAKGASEQRRADLDNAGLSKDAEAYRIATKGGKYYEPEVWIRACSKEGFDLAAIKDEVLPKAMQGMALKKKQAYLAKMKAERAKTQAGNAKLAAERAEHIAEDRAKKAKEESESLGEAVNNTVDDQPEGSGFDVE